MLKPVRYVTVEAFHKGFSSLAIIPAKQITVMLKLVQLTFNVGCGMRLE